MEIKNKSLKRRIIEISYKHGLSHLGSCLTAVDIIEEIFQTKKRDEKFVLSSGHAGLALYVVLEKHEGYDAEELFNKCGVHPDRILGRQYTDGAYTEPIDCSTGSLGQGFPIALGMALADRSKNVYCLISDGEMAEGSTMEATQIRRNNQLYNLIVHVNWNGWGAYGETVGNPKGLEALALHVHETSSEYLPFLNGQDAHYYTMTEDDYKEALKILS
jgi:transketolase